MTQQGYAVLYMREHSPHMIIRITYTTFTMLSSFVGDPEKDKKSMKSFRKSRTSAASGGKSRPVKAALPCIWNTFFKEKSSEIMRVTDVL
jgi:hypothetical protein